MVSGVIMGSLLVTPRLPLYRCRTSHASPHSCDNAALMEFLAALPGQFFLLALERAREAGHGARG